MANIKYISINSQETTNYHTSIHHLLYNMKKIVTAILVLLTLFPLKAAAQNENITTEDIIRYYPLASPEEKVVIDSLFSDFVSSQKANQIKSICNVPFGVTRSEAGRILRNKFGEPNYLSSDTHIVYNNVKYGGIDFDSIHFLFQSDGYNSFLNTVIFINGAKNKSKANEIMELYRNLLSKKYELSEDTDALGFKNYGGGVSPLWNGNWYDFMTNLSSGIYLTAVHTDVIEYEDNLVRDFGDKYGVRIIYGPFQYVTEDF